MCRVPGCSSRLGGGRFGASFNTLCNNHRQRDRRHGDPHQMPIRAAHLAPYIKSLQRRQRLRPEAPAWKALDARWLALVEACRGTVKVFEGGQPMNRWTFEAAGEIVKVAGQATPEAVWQTAVAMFLLRETDHHRFPSERSFTVQLGRRVRHLAETNRGTYWAPNQGRFLRVYRDPSRVAAGFVGDMLAEAFGVAGTWFARQEKAEAAVKAAERGAFYDALRDVLPVSAGAVKGKPKGTSMPSAGVSFETRTVSIRDIVRDPRYQVRGRVATGVIAKYANVLANGGTMPPIRLARVAAALIVVDGWHRLAAHERQGIRSIEAEVAAATASEAQWMAAEANFTHGLPLRKAEIRTAFRAMIAARRHIAGPRQLHSYRELAGLLGGMVRHTTVANWMRRDSPRSLTGWPRWTLEGPLVH